MTLSTSRTGTAGEIPTISGHRFVNNDQLIQRQRGDCVSVCNVQSDSEQLSSVFIEHFERPTELISLTEYPTLSYHVERESTIQPIVCRCPPFPFSSSRQVTHTGLQSTISQVAIPAGSRTRQCKQCKRTRQRQRSALINCIGVTRTVVLVHNVCLFALVKMHCHCAECHSLVIATSVSGRKINKQIKLMKQMPF